MSLEKAYKLLAIQEKISNNLAKELIDDGLVFAHGKKILLARALMKASTTFTLLKTQKAQIIFEDENILALNKPAFITSEKLAKDFGFPLLNRLDKETSGVLLLYKNEDFQKIAIEEFKKLRVEKSYVAIVKGAVAEEITIDENILTIKEKGQAYSKVSKDGKSAISKVYPLMIVGKKSLVRIDIITGRTHQIRVHLNYINHPIIGDEKYGKNQNKRVYLHSYKTKLLNYEFIAPIDNSFNEFGFDGVGKNKF